MGYCKKCGEYLPDNALFCTKCGTRTDSFTSSAVDESVQKSFCKHCGKRIDPDSTFCPYCGGHTNSKTNDAFTLSKGEVRKEAFYGNINKCPSCGADVPSFTAICPMCGHEFNSDNTETAIDDFTEELIKYDKNISLNGPQASGWDTWNIWLKIGWVILNIYTAGLPLLLYYIARKGKNASSNTAIQEKASFIENYVFPNERETLMEALLFAKSQVASAASGDSNYLSSFWEKVWFNKATQIYNKAQIVLKNDPDVERAYSDVVTLNNSFKEKKAMNIFAVVAIALVAFILFINYKGAREDKTAGNVSSQNSAQPQVEAEKESLDSKDSFPSYVDSSAYDCGWTLERTIKTSDSFTSVEKDGFHLLVPSCFDVDEVDISAGVVNLFAETGGAVVQLSFATDDTNITGDLAKYVKAYADGAFSDVINSFTESETFLVIDQEDSELFVTDKGLIGKSMKMHLIVSNKLNGEFEMVMLISPDSNKAILLALLQTENSEYDYLNIFHSMINEIYC